MLDVVAWQDRHFLVASIPTHRVAVHVKRIVAAGLKVGVVRQTETAAIKKSQKVKGSSAKCFTRSVTNVYTTGTLLPGEEIGEIPGSTSFTDSTNAPSSPQQDSSHDQSNVILSLCEASVLFVDANSQGSSIDQSSTQHRVTANSRDCVKIGICSVDLATGVMVYDEFDDDFLRGRLITRLAHLQPIEVLLPNSNVDSVSSGSSPSTSSSGLSAATARTVKMMDARGILERARVERVADAPATKPLSLKVCHSTFRTFAFCVWGSNLGVSCAQMSGYIGDTETC